MWKQGTMFLNFHDLLCPEIWNHALSFSTVGNSSQAPLPQDKAKGAGRKLDFKLPRNTFYNWSETRMRAVAEADCLGAVLVSGGVCRVTLGKILSFSFPLHHRRGNFRFNPHRLLTFHEQLMNLGCICLFTDILGRLNKCISFISF